MSTTTYFNPAALRFLRTFARNNNREWFAANKQRFEEKLRDPFLRLIGDLAGPLEKISSHYRADPKAQGGSMYRIYRDTRFSNDKTPYKAWLGARLFHERSRQVAAPSFYFHVQPGKCFVGGGLWHPEAQTLQRVRDFLIDNPAAWKKATRNKRFTEQFETGGRTLKRQPRGYPADHELSADLKRLDFTAWRNFSDSAATSAELPDIIIAGCKGVAPMVDYLCASLDLEF